LTTGGDDIGYTSQLDAVRRHIAHSRQYLGNAIIALQDGEAGKAGELLWGSMAQAFHAVAELRRRNVRTHRDLKNFVLGMSQSMGDSSLRRDFEEVEKLHDNFYDITHATEDVADIIPAVQRLTNRAISLLPPAAMEDSQVEG